MAGRARVISQPRSIGLIDMAHEFMRRDRAASESAISAQITTAVPGYCSVRIGTSRTAQTLLECLSLKAVMALSHTGPRPSRRLQIYGARCPPEYYNPLGLMSRCDQCTAAT